MMRDSQGRFVDRRTFAATVLLEVAVEEALALLRGCQVVTTDRSGHQVFRWFSADREVVAARLAEATRSADLLLKGAER